MAVSFTTPLESLQSEFLKGNIVIFHVDHPFAPFVKICDPNTLILFHVE